MRRIRSTVDPGSPSFRAFEAHNRRLVAELRERQRKARFERPERDIQRLRKQNKLLVRERIELLLDPQTPFLELYTLAANRAYDGAVPGAGFVTGIGIVKGREVLVMASDSSIKGGAWYPLTIRKMVRSLDIAIENRITVIHLVDAAGAFLPMQSEIFPDRYMGGRIFRNQCVLSALGVKQVALVLGHSTAGGAYIPTLCDYSIMVRGTGGVFLGGPPLVKAATGEDVTADELGGADVHSSISGTADYAVDSEQEGIALVREIVGTFARDKKVNVERREPEEPYYDPEELYGIIPDDVKKQFDMREVIARIVDGSRFHEFKPDYGTTAVCGFAFLYGWKVGLIGNNGVLFSDSAHKCTQFMQICNRDRIPLIFLQNITGFMVGKDYEHGGITKDGAKMLMVQTNLNVPKLTIMTNGSFGAGNYAMCGRAYDPRFLFTWPNAQISVMGMEQAALTLTQLRVRTLERQGKTLSDQERQKILNDITQDYLEKSSAYYSTSEMWDDGIIDPADTRRVLGIALSVALNRPFGLSPHGILRI
ncbi:MAG: methylcrotonoyl-CoA carboxylase [Deltaproteobacteria bacterium]|nr:methylcrotonoyl-CoA carboxylase [Deltaproteobacteria bacterium]MBW1951139.1 methylcrotonoyl-CoA carboxylase [Deltaproteobacteria bacterium]MBW2009685.1 methylcrotonoyl-CoA carboxylase [Deltaproteobacteria bacterium]